MNPISIVFPVWSGDASGVSPRCWGLLTDGLETSSLHIMNLLSLVDSEQRPEAKVCWKAMQTSHVLGDWDWVARSPFLSLPGSLQV